MVSVALVSFYSYVIYIQLFLCWSLMIVMYVLSGDLTHANPLFSALILFPSRKVRLMSSASLIFLDIPFI